MVGAAPLSNGGVGLSGGLCGSALAWRFGDGLATSITVLAVGCRDRSLARGGGRHCFRLGCRRLQLRRGWLDRRLVVRRWGLILALRSEQIAWSWMRNCSPFTAPLIWRIRTACSSGFMSCQRLSLSATFVSPNR